MAAIAGLLCLAAVAGAVTASRPNHLHDALGSVQGLLSRLLGPEYLPSFAFEVISADQTGKDVFEIAGSAGKVVISGNRGLSLAAGLHYYIKNYANASISWGKGATGNQVQSVPPPASLPIPQSMTRQVSSVELRYASNVVQYGYTSYSWTFDRSNDTSLPTGSSITWEEELDRLALWGVSHPLAFAGQEWVGLQTYLEAGLTQEDFLTDYLTSPSFLPWQRMGNIQRLNNMGLNETLAWITMQRDLQLKILERARSFGMTPVLAGFAGHIPQAFTVRFPQGSYSRAPSWNLFNATDSENFMFDPSDPLFVALGANFTRLMVETYGLNPADVTSELHFNADTFNEVDPQSADPAYLKACNVAVYSAMAQGVPQGTKAIFVMQGWLFLHEYWTPDRIEAYLSGVDNDSMIILDLYTDSVPIWNRPGVNSYFGKKWVWNMLLVFGGRRGLIGNLTRIAEQPFVDMQTPGSTMMGLGFTLEAIEQGIVLIDLLFDVAWRDAPPQVDQWLSNWVVRRYGLGHSDSPSLQQAWALLRDSVFSIAYDYDTTEHFCELEKRPALAVPSRVVPYSGVFPQVLRLFLQAGVNGEVDKRLSTYQYDLVDITRQALCVLTTDLINVNGAEYVNAAANANSTSRKQGSVLSTSKALGAVVQDLDSVLATDVNFLLGTWLHDAKLWARKPNGTDVKVDVRQFSRDLDSDARNLVTYWGYFNSGVEDYASKNGWSGLVRDYYGGRWSLFSQYLQASAGNNYSPIDWSGAYMADLQTFEDSWVSNDANVTYQAQPSGQSSFDTALSLVGAYFGGLASPYTPPASKYKQLANSDAVASPGSTVAVDIIQAQTVDTAALQWLCDTDSACMGFNSLGLLKNDTSTIVTGQQGTTLWIKL